MFGEWEDTPDEEELENARQLLELKKKLEKLSIDELERKRRIAEIEGNRMKGLEAQKEMAKTLIDDLNAAFTRSAGEGATAFGEMQQTLENMGISASNGAEAIAQLSGRLGELEDATDALSKAGDKAGQEFFGGIASKLGMASEAGGDFISKLRVIADDMKDPKYAANFANKFKEIFTFSNMATAGLMAVYEATIAVAMAADKATAAFAKQTGTGSTHRAEIATLGKEYLELGVTQEDAAKAFGSLFDKMPGFTQMSENHRKEISRLTVTLEKLGVATDDTAQLMSDLMKGQKMSADMAMAQTQELAMMAESLQMRAGTFVKQFIEARKVLAPFGAQAKRIFKDLTAQAQAAGTEVSTLMGIVGKFDTFGDAADAAGKLNAILGTQFSATNLLTMSHEKRVEALIRGMQAQGKNFKDMDRFTQMAIAQTLGIQDLNEAQKILGMDMDGYRRYQKESARAAKEQEEMEKKAQAAMDAMMKLKMAFANLSKFLVPVIEGFQKFAQTILDLSEYTNGYAGKIILLALVVKGLAMVFGPLLTILGGGFAAFRSSSMGVKIFGEVAEKETPKITGLSGAMAGLGASFLAIGVAIAIVVLSFAVLVYTFGQLGDNAGYAVIGIGLVSAAIVALVFILSSAANPVTAVGAGIIMGLAGSFAVLGMATAAAGVSVAMAFKEINKFMGESENFTKMATALEAIGSAFVNLNNAMSGTGGMMGGALNMLSGGLFGMVKGAVTKNPIQQMVESLQPLIDNADKLVPIFEGINTLFSQSEVNIGKIFTDMATGLQEVYNVINKESESGMQIQHTLENLALIQTGTSAGSSGVSGIIKAISGLKQEITAKITISGDEVKKLFEDGVVKVAAEL